VASDTSAHQIFILCVCAIVGDGIGMGLGDYLSALAEIQYIKSEEQREYYEVDNLLNDEKKEIIDIYLAKGFTLEDSNRIADLYSTNQKAFVNIMMLEELGLVVEDEEVARKCGLVTFIAFMVLGGIPSLPYIISSGIIGAPEQQWVAVVCIGVVELFSLGFAKAAIIGLNKWKSGLEMLILGSIITAIGFGVGILFKP
jgi:vacuolar iron transporter family protein